MITSGENLEPAAWAYEDREVVGGSWFARIQGEAAKLIGMPNHMDMPPGSWFYIPTRLEKNPKIESIKRQTINVPIGWPGSSDNNIGNPEEVGQLMGQNTLDLVEAWAPALLEAGALQSDLDKWAKELKVDIDTLRVKPYLKFYVCTAIAK